MLSYRRALITSATVVSLTAAAGLPAGAAAATAAPHSDRVLGLTLPTIPVVSTIVGTLPVVGGTTPTTSVLPTIPGLEALTSVLAPLPIVGGSDPTSLLGTLPPLPILSSVLPGGTGSGTSTDPLAALTSALPALTNLTGGLPVDGLPAGTVPTGAALKPVTDLLRQLAAAVAGTPLETALTNLADTIDSAGDGGVPTDVLSVLASTLGSISSTPGVPAPVKAASSTLATQLAPKPTTTTTTPVPVATTTKPATTTTPTPTTVTNKPATTATQIGSTRVSGVSVDRKHYRIRVALLCPSTSTPCTTFLAAYRGSKLVGTSPLLKIPAGGSLVNYVTIDSASKKAMKKATTKFKVSAVLPGGRLSTKTATTKLPKTHTKKKATKH